MNVFGAWFIMGCLFLKSVFTEPQNFSFDQNTGQNYDLQNPNSYNSSKYTDTLIFNNQFNRSTGYNRQSRNQKMAYTPSYPLHNGVYGSESSVGGGHYAPNLYASSEGGMRSTLESPFLSMRRNGYEDETENHGYGYHHEYVPDAYVPETVTEASDEAEEEDETEDPTTTTTTEQPETTTLAPFTLADVKVPAPFLRIEYMISFTFFGLMYGLGFFVLFQSLCVPAAKIAVYLVYIWLLKMGVVDPVTLEQALEQLPPT